MGSKEGQFCIVKSNDLSRKIFYNRSHNLKGNGVLAYLFQNRFDEKMIKVLADTFVKDEDYCVIEHIAFNDTKQLSIKDHNITIVPITCNAALKELFEKQIEKIIFEECMSDKEIAELRMKQIGFSSAKILEFKENNKIYVYDGIKADVLSKERHPELVNYICEFNKMVYAILRDPFENDTFVLLFATAYDDFYSLKLRNSEVFVLHAELFKTDGRHDGTYAGIQSDGNGIWCLPQDCMGSLAKRIKRQKET